MKHEITGEQIEFYRENGFVVIEDFLNPDELDRWRVTTQDAVRERAETNSGITNTGDPESYYAQVFLQCINLAQSHAGMRELMRDPRLGKLAATLSGAKGIRIWLDQALFKQPFGNPTAWHLDNPYWSFSSREAISLWVALDDATKDNGCLYYLPGTHKRARYENVGIGHNQADLFKVYPEWREIDPVGCPCPAGSAVLHNGLTAHGAGANMINKPRRAMTCAYMPDGSTFNGTQNILPPEYFQSLTVGDILNDPVVNPKIWPV